MPCNPFLHLELFLQQLSASEINETFCLHALVRSILKKTGSADNARLLQGMLEQSSLPATEAELLPSPTILPGMNESLTQCLASQGMHLHNHSNSCLQSVLLGSLVKELCRGQMGVFRSPLLAAEAQACLPNKGAAGS